MAVVATENGVSTFITLPAWVAHPASTPPVMAIPADSTYLRFLSIFPPCCINILRSGGRICWVQIAPIWAGFN
jgi:hypothetical protein